MANKIALYTVIIISGFGILLLIYVFTPIPKCLVTEEELEIPEYLLNTQIVFERPMFFVSENEPKLPEKNCTDSQKLSSGDILANNSNSPGVIEGFRQYGYEVETVPNGMSFTVIKRIYIGCTLLGQFTLCIDSGPPGDNFLLEASNGKLYLLYTSYLKNTDKGFRDKPWNAGYYKNGKRLGDVVVEAVF